MPVALADALLERALQLQRQGDSAGAGRDVDRALRLAPSDDVLVARGTFLRASLRRDVQDATRAVELARRADSGWALLDSALWLLSLLHITARNPGAAVGPLTELWTMRSSRVAQRGRLSKAVEAASTLADCEIALGRPSRARELHLEAVDLCDSAGDAAAEAVVVRWLAHLCVTAANAAAHQADWTASIELATGALERLGTTAEIPERARLRLRALNLRAGAWLASGNPIRALDDLEAVVRPDGGDLDRVDRPERFSVTRTVGRLAERAGALDLATRAYELARAAAAEPDRPAIEQALHALRAARLGHPASWTARTT